VSKAEPKDELDPKTQKQALDLTQEAYAGGAKNLEHVMDELGKMTPEHRRAVMNVMTRIDNECHKDPEKAKELGLPSLHIIDHDTAHGHKTLVWTTKPADHGKPVVTSHAERTSEWSETKVVEQAKEPSEKKKH